MSYILRIGRVKLRVNRQKTPREDLRFDQELSNRPEIGQASKFPTFIRPALTGHLGENRVFRLYGDSRKVGTEIAFMEEALRWILK